MMSSHTQMVEIIPKRLYFSSDKTPPRNKPNSLYFCIDNELVYEAFNRDFGPLNLGMTHKFCLELEKLLNSPNLKSKSIIHFTSQDPAKRANACFLMCAFCVIVLKRQPAETWALFSSLPKFEDFRDASFGYCSYNCSILDCIQGLERAISLGFYDYRTFDLKDYEFHERLENGDMNWIIPGKLLAFSCPGNTNNDYQGWRCYTPENYGPVFKSKNIGTIVRLNKKTYDAERFKRQGLKHHELYFLDGSVPSVDIIKQFISIVENEPGAVAVHCKAGLGRTGTLIGCYTMKHFDFPPAMFIGWIRICRPGSVLGPQQQFLIEKEPFCKHLRQYSGRYHQSFDGRINLSPNEMRIAKRGDAGQAMRLIEAKKEFQKSEREKYVNRTPAPRSLSLVEKAGTSRKYRANAIRNIFMNSPVSHNGRKIY